MKTFLLLLLSAGLALAQAPFNATNLKLTAPPVQGTAASVDRIMAIRTTKITETLTPTILWSAIVLTGTVDVTDISGISVFARTYLDDTTAAATLTTLGGTTVGQSVFSLTNPSAISFIRLNADNTATSRSATLFKTDLSLENVTNTSDANKPVSTAQQAALDLKAPLAAPTFTGSAIFSGTVARSPQTTTLAAAVTTLALTKNNVILTGDAGTNTLATITGGVSGMTVTILFTDSLVTITDTAAATANTINTSAAFTSTADDTMTLIYLSGKWFEVTRSVN